MLSKLPWDPKGNMISRYIIDLSVKRQTAIMIKFLLSELLYLIAENLHKEDIELTTISRYSIRESL
jgi:hypothetical protein